LKDGSANPLADARVRQALNYAVDKAALIKIVTFDVGTPVISYMSSATPLVSGDGPAYPYDPEKAKALLKERASPQAPPSAASLWRAAPTNKRSSPPSRRCGRRWASP
jgi:ABC-type dipeptide transport system, periplasmic component